MLTEIFKGLSITLRELFKPPVTIQYPEVKRPVRQRFRGRHELRRYADGLERCIGCALCAAACPAEAIYVEAAENTDAERYSPGERYAKTYEINMLRCIFCGYCEDACPTDAIVLTDVYELAGGQSAGFDLYQRHVDSARAGRQAGHAAAGERRIVSARDFAGWPGE